MTRNRFYPLYAATASQGFLLWVPVEKLFMTEIGFTAATIGVMVAAYAAMVPIVEVPSGILADRWSRRGVLIVASIALTVASLLGGLSTGVATYVLSMIPVGVYFAMYSGTMDAVVYDTVLEETGSSDGFERRLGRVRFVESVSLVASALAGGVIANVASTRLTYFLTVPFGALAVLALLRFREPVLHKASAGHSLRAQIALTYRTITRGGHLVPVVALAVLTSVLMQIVFEFGPLWLIALSASAILFGPFWAALVATLGLGGLLAGRLRLHRPAVLAGAVAAMVGASLALVTSRSIAVISVAQVGLMLLLAIVSIHVTKLLHDAVPSTVRSGVASGVSAFTWLAFVPVAGVFGGLGEKLGVYGAGWLIVAAVVAAGAVLVAVARRDAGTTDDASTAAELVGAR
jgi:predicted MFS family arabinose efflux permease